MVFFTPQDKDIVEKIKKLPKNIYYLECNGRVFYNLEDVGDNNLIQLHFRIVGGKGGFGSLLRSFRIHKSSNQLMCRNLSGRRLADVREEERLRKWISRKLEREKAKVQKKKEKIEKLKNGGASKHEFNDQNYLQKRDVLQDEVENAIEAGMQAIHEKTVRQYEIPTSSSAPVAVVIDEDCDSDIDINDLFMPGTSKRRNKRVEY